MCWQGLGATCMYCGDGVNDLLALAASDVGMAVGNSHASAAASLCDSRSTVAGLHNHDHEHDQLPQIDLTAICGHDVGRQLLSGSMLLHHAAFFHPRCSGSVDLARLPSIYVDPGCRRCKRATGGPIDTGYQAFSH